MGKRSSTFWTRLIEEERTAECSSMRMEGATSVPAPWSPYTQVTGVHTSHVLTHCTLHRAWRERLELYKRRTVEYIRAAQSQFQVVWCVNTPRLSPQKPECTLHPLRLPFHTCERRRPCHWHSKPPSTERHTPSHHDSNSTLSLKCCTANTRLSTLPRVELLSIIHRAICTC